MHAGQNCVSSTTATGDSQYDRQTSTALNGRCRLTAAALRGMLHLLYVGGTGQDAPAYRPPVRAVRLIIFLVAAWRAASSTLNCLQFCNKNGKYFCYSENKLISLISTALIFFLSHLANNKIPIIANIHLDLCYSLHVDVVYSFV